MANTANADADTLEPSVEIPAAIDYHDYRILPHVQQVDRRHPISHARWTQDLWDGRWVIEGPRVRARLLFSDAAAARSHVDFLQALCPALEALQAARDGLIARISALGADVRLPGVTPIAKAPRAVLVSSAALTSGWSARTYLVGVQIDEIIAMMRARQATALQEILDYADLPDATAAQRTPPGGGTHILVARTLAPLLQQYLQWHSATLQLLEPGAPAGHPERKPHA